MAENDPRIQQLLKKLNELQRKQEQFNDEIESIRYEIRQIQAPAKFKIPLKKRSGSHSLSESQKAGSDVSNPKVEEPKKSSGINGFIRNDLEKFIGENLINKIGILITIIGVAVGMRYAIDHDLISPAMRISLGYLVGLGLLFFALRLKTAIPKFSAVLFSGSMAVMYIITFSAYSFYGLFSMIPAYILMVGITVITVAASVNYNRQVVAHIGLVGAYAVPFLVGGDGGIGTLFFYMTVINTGVLSVAVYKNWKKLTLSAFGFTWLIFGTWYAREYTAADHFTVALGYAFIFFVIIYAAALAYKLLRSEEYKQTDIWLILANSFVFYGFGFVILSGHNTGSTWLGAFTLANALIHLTVGLLIYRFTDADKNLLYLLAGLVVTFFTITIPVELDGNWVTLLWTAEAALLFWIGRTNKVTFYEKMSHPVLALAFLSLLFDWGNAYPLYEMERSESGFITLFNIHFFTSLSFVAGISGMIWKDIQSGIQPAIYRNEAGDKLVRHLIRLVMIVAVYFAFRLEIRGLFNTVYIDTITASEGELAQFSSGNRDLLRFGSLWVYNYSMLFISLLVLASVRWMKQKDLALILFAAVTVTTVLFIDNGLNDLSTLKDHYLDPELNEPFSAGIFHIGMRYVCFLFLGLMLYATGRMVKREYTGNSLDVVYDALLYITILWILSNELMLWMDLASAEQPYKLGLSILWGFYALAIIALGITQGKKHLRIGSFILLGITLVKLFFYDIAHLDAIARTVVLITLGVLLLLASFLYNKFKKEME